MRVSILEILCIIFVFVINFTQHAKSDGLIEVFQWKQMDFYNRGENLQQPNWGHGSGANTHKGSGKIVFPDQLSHRNPRNKRAVVTSRDQPKITDSRWDYNTLTDNSNSSSYIPYNNLPMGATHFNGRLFVTLPRRRTGIPSSLNYIDMHEDGKNRSPRLRAYPNFETNYLDPNAEANPNRIISVYRTSVDACKRLWFIDTGMLEYPDDRRQVQRPSIWVIDLTNNRVLRRFEIPQSVAETGRGLASITIDTQPNRCAKAFAYLPDLLYNQLYVYSFENNRIWAFQHNYFKMDPLAGDLSIGGQTFRWDDGIFSITLGPHQANGYRDVYFHPMASNNEFIVSSEVLQNESNAARSDHANDFQLLGNRGVNRQSTMHEYDPRTGVIFYAEIQRNGIGCWNTKKTFSPGNHGTVTQDAQRMIYPSDLTIDEDGTIWVMTNSLPVYIYSNLDPNVVNFRVWKQNVYTAVKNTVCE